MCTTCVNLSCFGRLGHSCSYNTGGPGTIHPKSARCPLFAELQSECACRGAHRRGTKRSRVSDFEAARAAMVFWAAVPRMLDRTDMAVCQNLVPLVNIKIAGKWMFILLKMVLIGIDPYPYELMTCSLLTKMEQDGTRWNKVHMPWNPSTWFCDPSPPCPKLLPLPTSEPKGGRIPGLNPTIDPSITTTISELPCHQIHQLHVATPHTLKDLTKSKKLRKLRRQLFGVRGRALGHGIQNLQQFQEFLLCILSCKASQVTKVTQIFQNAAGSPFFDFLNCLSEANIDTYSNGSVVFFHILRSSPTF